MKNPTEEVTLHISNNTIIRVALFAVLFYLMYFLRDLIVVLLTSVILASSIEPVIKRMEFYRIPRSLTALVVLALIMGLFFWIISMFIPIVVNEFATLIDNIPTLLQTAGAFFGMTPESAQILKSLFGNPSNTVEIIQNAKGIFTSVGGGLISSTGAFFSTVANIFLIFVLTFYLAVQEKGIEMFIRTLTPKKNEEYAIDLWTRSQRKISKWMQGQLVLGLIIGFMVYIGLSVMGVPYALLLSILAGMLELIPVFGPIIAMVPAVLLTLSAFGPTMAVWVLAFYFVVQQLENNVIVPLVVNKSTGLNSLIVILSLLIGSQVAGFWGILLSVPLVSVFMEYIEDIQKGKGII